MVNTHLVLHLSLIQGIGPIAIAKIVAGLKTNLSDSYTYTVADWVHVGFSHAQATLLRDGLADRIVLEKELLAIEKAGVRYCTMLDDDYPQQLKAIYGPPPVIYYQGALHNKRKSIACIGSRQANHYAQRAITHIIPELALQDIVIVSGGAIGADAMAHKAALAAGGVTIAVLGSGLLKKYPYRNKSLFDEIIEKNGAVISSFPLATEPLPGNFIARNRVIAGLSDGVIVVQAATQSGTRSTAQFALEQGRDVFAVPGSIEDPLSAGCHALIHEGARIITGAHDILHEYGMKKAEAVPTATKQDHLQEPVYQSRYAKGSFEQQIVALCSVAQSLDELARATGKNLVELQSLLFQLQLDGTLEQEFTGLWRTV